MLYDGSSSPEEFVALGESFCRHILIPRGHVDPAMSILDLGCGNGAVARALTRFLSAAGRYEGFDVNGQGVAWLQETYRPFTNFRFSHADVFNRLYNPTGRFQPSQYTLPFDGATFDVVLLKSVFTHMMPADVGNYLREVGRVLKKSGRSIVTFFLLNDESRGSIRAGKASLAIDVEYGGDPLCRVLNLESPEFAVAHDEQRVRRWHTEAGFSLAEIAYGNWCGRQSLLGLQDLIVAIKD